MSQIRLCLVQQTLGSLGQNCCASCRRDPVAGVPVNVASACVYLASLRPCGCRESVLANWLLFTIVSVFVLLVLGPGCPSYVSCLCGVVLGGRVCVWHALS